MKKKEFIHIARLMNKQLNIVPLAVILFFGILTGNGGTADFIYGRI